MPVYQAVTVALTAVAAQSKTVSQRVADRLLSTLTKCLEKRCAVGACSVVGLH